MNRYTVEPLPELNSLLVRITGPLQIGTFPQLYEEVLDHPEFKKNSHIIWDALSSSIAKLKVEDLKEVFYAVKRTESRRGKSCSAWVYPEGRSYDNACLFKAAFAEGLKISYGVFSTVEEAKDWIKAVESRSIRKSPTV